MKHDDDELSTALRKLSALKPSPDFQPRLARALADVDRRKRVEGEPGRQTRSALSGRLMLMLPALASVGLAAHVALSDPTFDATHVAEHELELPAIGHAALDLALLLHHHDDAYASIRVDVPHGVHVTTSDRAIDSTPAPNCDVRGCVYEFMHPTDSSAPHVKLRVSAPGRYRMRVEHSSETKRVSETFVIHARR